MYENTRKCYIKTSRPTLKVIVSLLSTLILVNSGKSVHKFTPWKSGEMASPTLLPPPLCQIHD